MISRILYGLGITFFAGAAFVWFVLGMSNPGAGMDRMGRPLNPDYYEQVGPFFYWLVGLLHWTSILGGILALVGFGFTSAGNWAAERKASMKDRSAPAVKSQKS
jgi:hypothetical protein